MKSEKKVLSYYPKYFSESEFKRASPACSLSDMSDGFMIGLDNLRERCGIPLVISSAYRSVDHELSRGRSGSSSHCKGIAVDIRCNTSQNRFKILHAALELGFKRIGIHKNFIHIDADYTKPDCIWLYDGVLFADENDF